MTRTITLLALLAALVIGAATSRPAHAVCGPDCWPGFDPAWNTYGLPWSTDPIFFWGAGGGGDNASSICAERGGVKSISYGPGQGWNGEAIIVATVTCMDGTEHEVNMSGRGTQGGAQDGGDGNPNHTFEENNTPPTDPGTEYTQCPGTDDPAYDPNNEACW